MVKKTGRLLANVLIIVAAFVLLVIFGCAQSQAADKTLKIGCTITLSGTWAANGADMKNAIEMYLKERDYVLGGHKIELIIEDDEGQVETALNKVRKLVERDRVDLLFGSHAANIGYAIGQYAIDNEILYLAPCVAAEDLTQRRGSKYIIRTGWTTAQPMHPFGEWAYEQGYRRIAAVAFDYAFGHEGVTGFQRTFEEAGGDIVIKLWPAAGTTDYVPFVNQIPRDVDAIFAHFNGADSNRILTTIRDLGFTCDILGASTTTDEHILFELDREAALGVYSALQYCATSDYPATQEFVKKFKDAFGKVPSYYAMEPYAGLQMIEAGLNGAGGVQDVDAFTKALREAAVVTPKGVITLDDYNNPIQDIYIRKVELVDGELANVEIAKYDRVSQFWKYGAEAYLAEPVYGRVFNGK